MIDMSKSSTTGTHPNKDAVTPLPPWQILSVVFVQICESLNINVLFPFLAFLVEDFGYTGDRLGYYAGFLAASFCGAQFCSSIVWGILSDRFGRKPVIIFGVFGTAAGMTLFGFSKCYFQAVAGRMLSGLLSGNMGVIKSFLTEITDDSNRGSGFSVMSVAWAVGTIFAPLAGGLLCKPAEKYPDYFDAKGIFGQYPYLLPCLMCVAFNLMATVVVTVCMHDPKADKGNPLQEYEALSTESEHGVRPGGDSIDADESNHNGACLDFSDTRDEENHEFDDPSRSDAFPDSSSHGLIPSSSPTPHRQSSGHSKSIGGRAGSRGVLSRLFGLRKGSSETSEGEGEGTTGDGTQRSPDWSSSSKGTSRWGIQEDGGGAVVNDEEDSFEIVFNLDDDQDSHSPRDPSEQQVSSGSEDNTTKPSRFAQLLDALRCGCCLKRPSRKTAAGAVGSRDGLDGGASGETVSEEGSALLQPVVLLSTASYGILSMAYIVYDETVPLFLKERVEVGGFGLSTNDIGVVLSISGAAMLLFTTTILPIIAARSKLGSMSVALRLAVPVALLWPLLGRWLSVMIDSMFPAVSARLRHQMIIGVLVVVCVMKLMLSSVAFTSSMIIINNSVVNKYLGAANGLGQTFASFARALGPALGGAVWSLGVSSNMILLNFVLIGVLLVGCIAINKQLPSSLDHGKTDQRHHSSDCDDNGDDGLGVEMSEFEVKEHTHPSAPKSPSFISKWGRRASTKTLSTSSSTTSNENTEETTPRATSGSTVHRDEPGVEDLEEEEFFLQSNEDRIAALSAASAP